jgi:hypothetical protein
MTNVASILSAAPDFAEPARCPDKKSPPPAPRPVGGDYGCNLLIVTFEAECASAVVNNQQLIVASGKRSMNIMTRAALNDAIKEDIVNRARSTVAEI